MRALVCKAFGPADQLVVEDRPSPEPGPGEIRVAVKAAGINFPDHLMIQGLYQIKSEPPFVPGVEAAGVIDGLGAGVKGLAVGQPVIAMSPDGGAFAEQLVVSANQVLPMPTKLSFEQAAGVPIAYATSYHAYKQLAGLKTGETVLVLGAAGGVGTTAVELGKAMGARVIAAASSEEKLAFAREVGADETINYQAESLRDAVKSLTDGQGVDLVYDPVGGELAIQAMRSLAWRGRYLVIGFACGDIPSLPANLALLKEASVIGVWWGAWAAREPQLAQQNFIDLLGLIESGQVSPRTTASFDLAQYVEAFQAIDSRQVRGKVVFTT
jgi:NADPH2:quinone reductase